MQQATNTKANYADSGVTPEQLAAVEALGASGNVFERLAASIAPEVRVFVVVVVVLLFFGGWKGAHAAR